MLCKLNLGTENYTFSPEKPRSSANRQLYAYLKSRRIASENLVGVSLQLLEVASLGEARVRTARGWSLNDQRGGTQVVATQLQAVSNLE